MLNRDRLGGAFSNPGGQSVVSDGRRQDLVFHASTGPARRSMFVLGLAWTDDGRPVPDLRDGLTHRYRGMQTITAISDDGCAGRG